MKTIPLTQGRVALVDDEDHEYLSQFKWFARKDRNTFYAARNKTRPGKSQAMIHMHRELMGTPEGLETDHKDRDGLNNQKNNLRVLTHARNMRNLGTPCNNTSGFKGVSWDKKSAKFRAYVCRSGMTHLGFFQIAEDAANAVAAYVARNPE